MPLGPKCLTFVSPRPSPFFRNRDDVSQPEVYGFMTQVFEKAWSTTRRYRRKAQNVNMSRGPRADWLKSYVPDSAETAPACREVGRERHGRSPRRS